MGVLEKPVEHGRDRRRIAEQLAPGLDRAVRGQNRAGPLVAPHDDLEQVLGRRRRHRSPGPDESSPSPVGRQRVPSVVEKTPLSAPAPIRRQHHAIGVAPRRSPRARSGYALPASGRPQLILILIVAPHPAFHDSGGLDPISSPSQSLRTKVFAARISIPSSVLRAREGR